MAQQYWHCHACLLGVARTPSGLCALPSSLQREGLEQFADDELEYEGTIQAGPSCPPCYIYDLPP